MLQKIKFYIGNWRNLFDIKKISITLLYNLYFFRLTNKKFKGLHLGSGNIKINGFLNIDANIFFNSDLAANIKKLKINSESVESIYNSHILEHFKRKEAPKVLREWYRILSKGGLIYICVPDLEEIFSIYLDNLKKYNQDKESKRVVNFIERILYGGQNHKYNFHYNGFSFLTLKELLESAGFKDIEKIEGNFFGLQDGSTAAFGSRSISLNIKATK